MTIDLINPPSTENKITSFLKSPLAWAFILSLLYWIYLAFSTTMIIIYDADVYEKLGATIFHEGWRGFFSGNPKNEPLYPALISTSMVLEHLSSVPHLSIQRALQLMILFITQLLSLAILKKLRIHPFICAATILYMGISPALVNASISLFSEVMTFPFVLGIVLMASQTWHAAANNKRLALYINSMLFSFLFLGLTLIKGIYEYIFFALMMLMTVAALSQFLLRKRTNAVKITAFILIATASFSLPMHFYKSLNKKYNGVYTLTDNRGDFSLYSSASRRTEDLSGKQILAGIAFTGGEGCCRRFFDEKDCYFWGIHQYDSYGVTMLKKVQEEYPKAEVSGVMRRLSKEKIAQKPVQFALLTALEYLKMFFWESTQIGFVNYAPWQTKLYAFAVFKGALRLIVSLLSLWAFVNAFIILLLHIGKRSPPAFCDERLQIICIILLIASCHIFLYSIFMTIPRFIFPIAPLYLLLIAFCTDNLFFRKKA